MSRKTGKNSWNRLIECPMSRKQEKTIKRLIESSYEP